MKPKQLIKQNIGKIYQIYDTVINNIDRYVSHVKYNEHVKLNDKTISIVMTTHERIKQTLFSLETINNSLYKNIQVIIIDDSTSEFISNDQLTKFLFRIDYLKIKLENRDWINPCINYNIGFKYIEGSHVIIQNSEICHFGDVVDYVHNNCIEGNYLVFDVVSTKSYDDNNKIYDLSKNNNYNYLNIQDIIFKDKYLWYQHQIYRPANFHFLTAIHINDLRKLNLSFDFDMALGRWYDDDEFIYRIRNVLKLNITNISFDVNKLLGIHQYHDIVKLGSNESQYQDSIILNKYIIDNKIKYFINNNNWLHFYNYGIIDASKILDATFH